MPKKLFKALLVLAVVAAALGGAAALGSTLFDDPPRDAAEFAERVEKGSRYADRNRRAPKAKKRADRRREQKARASGPTPTERRYGRTLSDWCVEQEREVGALGDPYDAGAWLESWLTLSRSWRARVSALAAPPRFRDARSRYLGSWERLDGLSVDLVRASAQGDSVAHLETYDRWIHAAARHSDAALAMGADRCAGALFQGITTG